MMFLVPVGGVIDNRFGILATYAKSGAVAGIKAGMPWAADNCAFTRDFDPDRFFAWLESMKPYRETCLFVVCPDRVGDAAATLGLFAEWQPRLFGWPVAFVAQDGQEALPFPDPALWEVLFVGGTTAWKEGEGAISCIKRAQLLGKRIHIGRVNWGGRYDRFRLLEGSEAFTCDGTRTRFDGTAATLEAWAGYQQRIPLIQL